MTSDALETLRARLRDGDRDLLRALAARARFPRDPRPRWPDAETRLPPPPLAEILLALSPAGTAADPSACDAANRGLIRALLGRQRLAREIADAQAALRPDDFRAAMEAGGRRGSPGLGDGRAALDAGGLDRLLALLTDLPGELRTLDFVRADAAESAPALPGDLASLLWRELLLPWTARSEAAHLLEP